MCTLSEFIDGKSHHNLDERATKLIQKMMKIIKDQDAEIARLRAIIEVDAWLRKDEHNGDNTN